MAVRDPFLRTAQLTAKRFLYTEETRRDLLILAYKNKKRKRRVLKIKGLVFACAAEISLKALSMPVFSTVDRHLVDDAEGWILGHRVPGSRFF